MTHDQNYLEKMLTRVDDQRLRLKAELWRDLIAATKGRIGVATKEAEMIADIRHAKQRFEKRCEAGDHDGLLNTAEKVTEAFIEALVLVLNAREYLEEIDRSD